MDAGPAHRVVVVGGSAGGLGQLTSLAAELPEDLPAAVLAVLHFPATAVSRLAAIVSRSSRLAVTVPTDGEPLRAGHVYVPRPDQHLMVGRGRVRLSRAARENGMRPAVDPLFRSAARHYGRAAIGVVLCGNLDDGSSGLLAIRTAGGTGVVVEPETCAFSDMPRNAIAVAQPDHVVPLDGMGRLIDRLVREPVERGAPLTIVPGGEEDETMDDGDQVTWGDDRAGRPSGFSCPECHGVLWEVDQPGMPRFVCRVGHRISAETLLDLRGEEVEGAVWAAVRALEEQASLAERLRDRATDMGSSFTEDRFSRRAADARRQAEILRSAALRSVGDAEAEVLP
jgi:two-component system chemotaxis response regulator CheB